jgi:hypothetical protein
VDLIENGRIVTGRGKRERERREEKKERKEKKGRERNDLALGSVQIFCDRTRVIICVSIRILI